MPFPAPPNNGLESYPQNTTTGFLVPQYGSKRKPVRNALTFEANSGERSGRKRGGNALRFELVYKEKRVDEYDTLLSFFEAKDIFIAFNYFHLLNETWYVCYFEGEPESTANSFDSEDFTVVLKTKPLSQLVNLVQLQNPPPYVMSCNRSTNISNPSNNTCIWRVAFSEPVSGITYQKFSLVRSGVTGGSITNATAISDTLYEVTATGFSGNGTVRLDIPSSNTVTDAQGGVLDTSFTSGEVFSIDQTAPVVESINRASGYPSPTINSLRWRVTFSKAVTGLLSSHFSFQVLNGSLSGYIVSAVTQVSGAIYDVDVVGVSSSGELRLVLNANAAIRDIANNALSGNFTTGQTFVVDQTAPVLSSTVIANASPNQITLTYNETLDNTQSISTAVFSISSTVNSVTITSVTVSGATLILGLSGNIVQDDNVTISYNVPGTGGKIRDTAGNNAAGLGSQSITNNVSGGGAAPSVPNGNFEAGSYSTGANYINNVTENSWVHNGNYDTGIYKDGTGQVLFIESTGKLVSQAITFAGAGNYKVRFKWKRRYAGLSAVDIKVLVDSTVVVAAEVPPDGWTTKESATITLSSGSHTIKFTAENAGTYMSFINDVEIIAV